MKMNNFRGDLTDISAKTEALLCTRLSHMDHAEAALAKRAKYQSISVQNKLRHIDRRDVHPKMSQAVLMPSI